MSSVRAIIEPKEYKSRNWKGLAKDQATTGMARKVLPENIILLFDVIIYSVDILCSLLTAGLTL